MSRDAELEDNGHATTIHELRNALNTISTTVQMQEYYLTKRPDNLYQLLSETIIDLKTELRRLEALVDKLQGKP